MSEYYNPQQEPGSERRLLLVFAITFIVLLVFQPMLSRYLRKNQTPPKQQQEAQNKKAPPAPATAEAPTTAPAPHNAAARPRAATPSAASALATVQAKSEADTVVENDLYRVTFTNRGAQVKSWILKKYTDERGQPLDLVLPQAAATFGYPLSLWTYDENLRNQLNSALYVTSTDGQTTTAAGQTLQAPAEVTFSYADQQLQVRKTFRFDHSYVIYVSTQVTRNGQAVTAYPAWPAGFGDQGTPASFASSQIISQNNAEKVERLAAKNISGGNTLNGPFSWIGVCDQYFAAAFIPGKPSETSAVTLRNALEVPRDPKNASSPKVRAELLGLAVGNRTGETGSRLFVGPKALDVLESVPTSAVGQGQAPDLRGLVNFGFFSVIARPLFLWLRWTYEHMVSNWGWAIVVLTLIINLVLFPLRLSSMKSAMKMQKIQPQVNAIKEKYKKYGMRDPRRAEMNQEVAALFKREGANPAGGCLPLLIQMPFLFAFYSMLGSAIELRHANWLWIKDLSSPDPYYIIPILIIASTFLMQKMTPQAGMDPSQQRMMTVMMPIMLGVISWSLSAGLGVYWILGNAIGVAQQMVLNRTHFGREMRAMAEKRARQRAVKS